MKGREFLPAFSAGLACHLLILAGAKIFSERVPFPMLKTIFYALGLVAFGVGALIRHRLQLMTRNGFVAFLLLSVSFLWAACDSRPLMDIAEILARLYGSKISVNPVKPFGLVHTGFVCVGFLVASAMSGAVISEKLASGKSNVRVLLAVNSGFVLAFFLFSSLLTYTGPAVFFAAAIIILTGCQERVSVPLKLMGAALQILFVVSQIIFTSGPELTLASKFNAQHLLTRWSPYNRLDFIGFRLKDQDFLAAYYNFIPMWTVSPQLAEEPLAAALLYKNIRPTDRILLLGAGGGRTLHRLLSDFPKVHVTANEIDPVVVGLMRGDLGQFNGFAYNNIRADVITGDARLAVDLLVRTGRKFDKIIVEGLDTRIISLNRSMVPVESFLFTAEGVMGLKQLLEPQGLLLNYMTGSEIRDIDFLLKSFSANFANAAAFARIAQMPLFEGLPIYWIASAHTPDLLQGFLKPASEAYRFHDLPETKKQVLTDERPVFYPIPRGFWTVFTAASLVLVFATLRLAQRSGSIRFLGTASLGISYLLCEMYFLETLGRSFVAPDKGQFAVLAVLLGSGLLGNLVYRYVGGNRWILLSCGFVALAALFPASGIAGFAVVFCVGFGSSFAFLGILENFGRPELLYGVETLFGIIGLLLFFGILLSSGFSAIRYVAIATYLLAIGSGIWLAKGRQGSN